MFWSNELNVNWLLIHSRVDVLFEIDVLFEVDAIVEYKKDDERERETYKNK